MSKLQEMLAEYRRLTLSENHWPLAISEQAQAIADYLLTLDASDLDARDRSNPACPSVDAARRPHISPMDEIDFE